MKTKIDSNMKIYILNGMLFTVMLNLYQPFAVKFLQRIGGVEFHVSLFNAIPGLAAVLVTIPGSIWLSRFERKKKAMAGIFLLSRAFIFSFALVTFLPLSLQPAIFLILFMLMNMPKSMSNSALQSFTGDLFKGDTRVKAIALFNKFGILASIIVTLIAGQVLSRVPKSHGEQILIYQILFVISFLVGIAEIIVFTRLKEPERNIDKSVSLKQVLISLTSNKKFTGFVKRSLLFHFGWQMAWPLFNIYYIFILGADEMWLSIISIAMGAGNFLSYSFWNRMITKKGNAYIVMVVAIGMIVNPIFVAVSPNLYIITLLTFVSGFFTAGTITVFLSYLLEVTPEENRVIYVGTYNTLINLSLFVAPFAAHAVFKGANIYIALIAASVIRFAGGIAFFIGNRKKNRQEAPNVVV